MSFVAFGYFLISQIPGFCAVHELQVPTLIGVITAGSRVAVPIKNGILSYWSCSAWSACNAPSQSPETDCGCVDTSQLNYGGIETDGGNSSGRRDALSQSLYKWFSNDYSLLIAPNRKTKSKSSNNVPRTLHSPKIIERVRFSANSIPLTTSDPPP